MRRTGRFTDRGLALSESGGNTFFCGSCGHPLNSGERFCGNCGAAVNPTGGASHKESTSGSYSPMLFVGVAMILVSLFAVVGVVFFGDRLGFASNDPPNAPEPARLLEPSQSDGTDENREEPEPDGNPPDRPDPQPTGAQTPEAERPEEETSEQEFITRYYDAAGASDWSATYSLLDSSSRAEFTESEWAEAQEARVAETDPPPLRSATLQDFSGEEAGFTGDVLLSYTDGSSEVVPVQTVYEDDGLRRYLTPEDVDYLRGLDGGSENPNDGVAENVERFVYEYYETVAAGDWAGTYSMLDYGGRESFTEAEWIERQETRQAASGGPSPVADVSVSVPDDYAVNPTVNATVTFADGEVVEITVVNPHSMDGEYDRVLTDEEIAYLQGL